VTRSRRAPRLLLVALAVLAAALAGCGGGSSPETVEVVVPAGTQERLDAGESVVVMPSVIELQVGDTLRIRNDDDVDQTVGPYFVTAGEEIALTYSVPGRYEGYCPVSEGERYEIVVTER
jgi:plastocyanin